MSKTFVQNLRLDFGVFIIFSSVFIVYACSEYELVKDSNALNANNYIHQQSAHIRNSCPLGENLIINGDFSNPFTFDANPCNSPCTEGNWIGFRADPVIDLGEAVSRNVCLGRNQSV